MFQKYANKIVAVLELCIRLLIIIIIIKIIIFLIIIIIIMKVIIMITKANYCSARIMYKTFNNNNYYKNIFNNNI